MPGRGLSQNNSDNVAFCDITGRNRPVLSLHHSFALWGDVTDDPLDCHWRALSLIMSTPYRERPIHSRSAYDVTHLRYLRRVGEVQPAPHGAFAAAVQRCGKVKLLKRAYMMQMCDALQLVGPGEDASSSAIDEALRELDAELNSRSAAATAFHSAMDAAPAKAEATTSACFAVLRTVQGGAGPGPAPAPAPSPAPAPPPPSTSTAESVYRSLFDGLPPGVAGSSKSLVLQVIAPCSDRLLTTQQAVGACCGAEAARLGTLYAFRKGLG